MKRTFCFWNFNLNKLDRALGLAFPRDVPVLLANLVQKFEIDVLVLAECSIDGISLLSTLRGVDRRFDTPEIGHERFLHFTRFPATQLIPHIDDERLAVHRLTSVDHEEILVAAFHYLDSRNYSPDEQWRNLVPHVTTLRRAEKLAGHSRTILFGDFNMNPYHKGMLDSGRIKGSRSRESHESLCGLGAMMTRDLAENFSETGFPSLFYNPMWKLLGNEESPGTYYWGGSDPSNPFWHCPDGLLIRPTLLDAFLDENLRILRHIPGVRDDTIDLIRRTGTHCRITVSDHLPVLFSLNLSRNLMGTEVKDA